MTSSTLLVVAIDFGTTFSGYAFSFKSKPTEVRTNQSWSKSLVSMKTPTVILVDKDRKFNAFGYEAEEKYTQLLEDGEAEGWALFRRFKMTLYKNPDLSKSLEVIDLSGKVKIPAIAAFSMAIRYLKDHALATLNERRTGKLIIDESDIHFVLTVPAIWDDRARLFMREAAADAGIPNERFSLALESEAASVWCQNVPFVVSTDGGEYDIKTVGSKYMVVDIGGTTAQETDQSPKPAEVVNWTWATSNYRDHVTRKLGTFSDFIAKMALHLYPENVTTPEHQLTSMTTDIRLTCGNDYLALVLASGIRSPVYRYVATYYTKNQLAHPYGNYFPVKYAYHGIDIFGFFESMDHVLENPLTQRDISWIDRVQREVMAFVKTGMPETSEWKPYPYVTAELDTVTRAHSGYHTSQCEFWLQNGFFSYSWIN